MFTEHDAVRRFVGTATPESVRRGLAKSQPILDVAYAKARRLALSQPDRKVEVIVDAWTDKAFHRRGHATSESDVKQLLTSTELVEIVELDSTPVDWQQATNADLQGYLVLERGKRFVPIVEGSSLRFVVDADLLARRIAVSAVRSRLE